MNDDPGRTEVLTEQTSQGKSQDDTHRARLENKSKPGQEDKVPLKGSFFERTSDWMKSMKKKQKTKRGYNKNSEKNRNFIKTRSCIRKVTKT